MGCNLTASYIDTQICRHLLLCRQCTAHTLLRTLEHLHQTELNCIDEPLFNFTKHFRPAPTNNHAPANHPYTLDSTKGDTLKPRFAPHPILWPTSFSLNNKKFSISLPYPPSTFSVSGHLLPAHQQRSKPNSFVQPSSPRPLPYLTHPLSHPPRPQASF